MVPFVDVVRGIAGTPTHGGRAVGRAPPPRSFVGFAKELKRSLGDYTPPVMIFPVGFTCTWARARRARVR